MAQIIKRVMIAAAQLPRAKPVQGTVVRREPAPGDGMSCFRVGVTLNCGSFMSSCMADVCQELAFLDAGGTHISPTGIKSQGKSSGVSSCSLWVQGRPALQKPACGAAGV